MREGTECTAHNEEHIIAITANTERSINNSKRLDSMEELVKTVHEMNSNIKIIATEMQHQGKNMEVILDAQQKTQQEVDDIKEKMETKDTVGRLHERIDTLEKSKGRLAIEAWTFVIGLAGSAVVGYIVAGLTAKG